MNAPKLCKIDGCDKPAIARGWCGAHWARWKRNGNPLAGRTPDGEPLKFFNEVVLAYRGDECLTWPFGANSQGYGTVQVDGKTQRVHRLVCEHRHGPPPTPNHDSAHSCGRGHLACVNQMHLVWKTSAENEADKLTHGTHNRGERCGASRLTEPDVHEIRRLLAYGETQQAIADRFGVHLMTVNDINTGRSWAWLAPHPNND